MPELLSLTRTEAEERGRLIAVQRYDIEIDLREMAEGPLWRSRSTVAFTCAEPGADTFVDAAGDVSSATLNGVALDLATLADGRLPLPGLAAQNTLVVEMTQTNTEAGEGILRTVDPTDKLVYVWTSLEADEARRLWACFDQPDLKAPHRFVVHAPDTWLVTSNGAPESVTDAADGAGRTWTYPDTPRLSTYVVVVNAGPFHEVRVQHDGYDLGFYCRQSLVPHLERDLDELVTITRQGLAYFGEKFGLPFPQERYDQVFVPNLGGAMENWGCVTYGDSQLFRTPPTHDQREVRAEFILHEMAHMWFGDLVTMQWWDDLWLNEAFASWAACWAMANATEFTGIWASFLAGFKRTAYEMDLSPAAHPIRGVVDDVSAAMANFDAITYVKGQSVLHQLAAFIGEDAFVAGLQDYFARFSYGNTRLVDLMECYTRASGQDLRAWTSAWLDRSGPDQLALGDLVLTATSPDDLPPRPHRLDIATYAVADGGLRPVGVTPVALAEPAQVVGLPAGDLHLLNAGDLTYAVTRPDAASRSLMFEHIADLPDALSRALVINTATQLLLLGEIPGREAAAAAARALTRETDASVVESFLAMGYSFADVWARPDESGALKSALGDACLALAEHPEHTVPALQRLAACATTPAHWERLDAAAAAATDTDLAWRMLARRAELGDLDQAAVEALLETDPDPDAGVKRLKVLASAPDADAKEQVWRAFFVDHAVPASRDTLLLGAMFWRPEQSALLQPFAVRYLDELGRLTGGLLNQGVVIRAMYPRGVGDEAFLAAADDALAGDTISNYAKTQVAASGFVQRCILRTREL